MVISQKLESSLKIIGIFIKRAISIAEIKKNIYCYEVHYKIDVFFLALLNVEKNIRKGNVPMFHFGIPRNLVSTDISTKNANTLFFVDSNYV